VVSDDIETSIDQDLAVKQAYLGQSIPLPPFSRRILGRKPLFNIDIFPGQ
jgi:hypothetical protein